MEEKIKKMEHNFEQCKEEVMSDVAALRQELLQIKSDTQEILGIFKASKGFFKVSSWIGKGILFTAAVTAAAAAIKALFKGW